MKIHVKNMALVMAAVMMLTMCSCDINRSSKKSKSSDEIDADIEEYDNHNRKVSGTKPGASGADGTNGAAADPVMLSVQDRAAELVFDESGPSCDQILQLSRMVMGLERDEAVELLEMCFGAELEHFNSMEVDDYTEYSYATSIVIFGQTFDEIKLNCSRIAGLNPVYGITFDSVHAPRDEMSELYLQRMNEFNEILGVPEFQSDDSAAGRDYDSVHYEIGEFIEFDLWCSYMNYSDPNSATVWFSYEESYY